MLKYNSNFISYCVNFIIFVNNYNVHTISDFFFLIYLNVNDQDTIFLYKENERCT